MLALCGGLIGSLASSGCGEARQDANEASGRYRVQIVRASFPARQRISEEETLELQIRNASLRTIPNLAVTLDSLSYQSTYPHLSDPKRPIWIVDRGPGPRSPRPVETAWITDADGGATAYVNTWALGPLAPGRTRTFAWHVTPVKAGLHKVFYIVAGGLSGKAHAVLAGGAVPAGRFVVHVAPAPLQTHVNPVTGAVEVGPAPLSTGPVGVSP